MVKPGELDFCDFAIVYDRCYHFSGVPLEKYCFFFLFFLLLPFE